MSDADYIHNECQLSIMRLQEDVQYWKSQAILWQDIACKLKEASYQSVLDFSDALMSYDEALGN